MVLRLSHRTSPYSQHAKIMTIRRRPRKTIHSLTLDCVAAITLLSFRRMEYSTTLQPVVSQEPSLHTIQVHRSIMMTGNMAFRLLIHLLLRKLHGIMAMDINPTLTLKGCMLISLQTRLLISRLSRTPRQFGNARYDSHKSLHSNAFLHFSITLRIPAWSSSGPLNRATRTLPRGLQINSHDLAESWLKGMEMKIQQCGRGKEGID